MPLIQITEPQYSSVVTNADIEAHLRIGTIGTTDELLDAVGGAPGIYVAAAVEYVNAYTRRAVCTQTLEQVMDAFGVGSLHLASPPLQSVTSISYIDPAGDSQTVDPANYTVDTANARITPVNGWPATKHGSTIAIRYIAGYPDGEVPYSIKAAVLLLIGGMYEHRESESEIKIFPNLAVDRLLWPYRVF